MAKKPLRSAKRSASRVPRLQNVASVKGTLRKGTLLHCTAEQWERAVRGIPTGKAVPKYGIVLAYYPLPDEGGVINPECVLNPCEICQVRTRPIRGGGVSFECRCRPDPRCPTDPPPPAGGACLLTFNLQSRPVIRCVSQGCTRRCRLSAVRHNGRIVITCACS